MNYDKISDVPEENLALGVLRQAAQDLRRFHQATGRLERELYLDAYRWITASDFIWPYSFINICKLVNAPPETLRAELLGDASLGWFAHSRKTSARLGRSFRASLARAFNNSRNGRATAFHARIHSPHHS